jgi:hypothetical protein
LATVFVVAVEGLAPFATYRDAVKAERVCSVEGFERDAVGILLKFTLEAVSKRWPTTDAMVVVSRKVEL